MTDDELAEASAGIAYVLRMLYADTSVLRYINLLRLREDAQAMALELERRWNVSEDEAGN